MTFLDWLAGPQPTEYAVCLTSWKDHALTAANILAGVVAGWVARGGGLDT